MGKIYIKTQIDLKTMPKSCEDCILSDYNLTRCMAEENSTDSQSPKVLDAHQRPEWCPLGEDNIDDEKH